MNRIGIPLALAAVLLFTHQAQAEGLDLKAEIDRTREQIQDPAQFRPDNAATFLKKAHADLFALDPEAVDYERLDADPEGAIRSLFELCVTLDDRCAEFHAQGALSDEIANAKRRALRGVRYAREVIALRIVTSQPQRLYEKGKPALAETYGKPYWTVREEFMGVAPTEFPRTFVILTMGTSNVSAAIARSAEEGNVFSHLAIGYRSNEPHTIKETAYPTGTLFIVEALIETGVIIHPLEEHYASSDRDVIFFVRDEDKQPAVDAAADAFFKRAKDGINSGTPLGYDFSMGTTKPGMTEVLTGETAQAGQRASAPSRPVAEPDAYFCAAVGDAIFDKAGVELFTTRTRLKNGETTGDMFESWGIDPDQPVTAPGDADVSPNLKRIAEGCVIQSTELNHVRQAVLFQMFAWMDALGYRLRWPWWFTASSAVLAKFNDSWIDLGLVPSGMEVNSLRTSYALEKAATLYVERLLAETKAFKQEKGRSMTPKEMLARLDDVRDDVKGTKKWFRLSPRARGQYALTPTRSKGHVQVLVSDGPGMTFQVERTVTDSNGAVLSRSTGIGSQKDDSLSVRFKTREGKRSPRSITYRLEMDGAIRGSARVDRPGRRRSGAQAQYRTIERGERVAQ
jgi:hypothetical protein